MPCISPSRGLTRVLFLLSILIAASAHAGTLYVRNGATGSTHNGTSWATAFLTVQQGLNAAAPGDEVWVAAGTYPERITLKNGVGLYGGFAGTETARVQRNSAANPTILDGQQGTPVVKADSSVTQMAVIDGFTLRNGIGDNSSRGSGIYSVGAWLTISHNVVIGNDAEWGGGIYYDGGGVRGAITGNLVTGNQASTGGGVYLANADGIVFSNNIISGNSAYQGGAISSSGKTQEMTGLTVTCNETQVGGCVQSSGLVNSLVAFNSSGVDSTASVRACDVYGNASGNYANMADPTGTNGNISVDPKLAFLFRWVHLQPGSPCIDAGEDSAVAPTDTDIDGQARRQGTHVDIGADESDGTLWPVAPRIFRVSTTGSDANDGSTWAKAKKTFAGAFALCLGGEEVWVAKGTYYGRLSMPAGVSLYGGFAGTETVRSQRNWKTNATILDGNKTGPVVSAPFMRADIDGFTIRNGQNEYGGGIVMGGSDGVVENNTITGNTNLWTSGGGVWAGPRATIRNNTISGNSADEYGGGVYCSRDAVITGNTISNNTANLESGGGICCYGVVTIANNTISGNTTTNGGGGGIDLSTGTSPAFIHDNLIVNNHEPGGGGGGGILCYSDGGTVISNNTLCGNTVSTETDGTVEGYGITLANNIIAFNTTGIHGSTSGITPRNNNVYGNTYKTGYGVLDPTGTNGNIGADPLFVNRSGGDYHLRTGSPCINTGDDASVPAGSTDLGGLARKYGAHVDMGAYEYGTVTPFTVADVALCLRISAGLVTGASADVTRLDMVPGTPKRLDILDAVRVLRKTVGVDPYP